MVNTRTSCRRRFAESPWERCLLGGLVLFVSVVAPFDSQLAASWRDPSPHRVQFVPVGNGVRLEVLDWGGSGRALVLLAGGGNTAHVFDNFAPKLTACCHVYGITRRGFGASGFSPTENPGDRIRDDLLAAIDALKLTRPVLAGHSIAGVELSAVAAKYPNRIAGLIYLEAGYPYAFENGKGPAMTEFLELRGPQPPDPGGSDLANFSALQKWDSQVDGFQVPEAELRQIWDRTSGGRPRKLREAPGSQMFMRLMAGTNKYTDIPAPALVIFAIPHIPEAWMRKSTDPAVRKAADDYFAKVDALSEKQAKVFEQGVAGAHVIRLRGSHYIFLSNESEVLREMRVFISGLK